MEMMKPFRTTCNRNYQQLRNSHPESHNHDFDECHDKEHFIGNGLEVAIVHGEYKSTNGMNQSYSNNEEPINTTERRANSFPYANKPLWLQDGENITNAMRIESGSDKEEFHEPQENVTHGKREITYDFLGESDMDSWAKKAQVESEIDIKSKSLKFDIKEDIPYKLQESLNGLQHHIEINKSSQENNPKTNESFSFDLLHNFEKRTMLNVFEVEEPLTTQFLPSDYITMHPKSNILELESKCGGKMKENESEYDCSFASSHLPEHIGMGKTHFGGQDYFYDRKKNEKNSNQMDENLRGTHHESRPSCSGISDFDSRAKFRDWMEKLPAQFQSCNVGQNNFSSEMIEEKEENPFKDVESREDLQNSRWKWAICLELIALLILIAGLISCMTNQQLQEVQLLGLELWKWMTLVLIMVCGRLLSNWIIYVIVYIIEKNFLFRKRVMYFVYALRRDVRNCMWLTFVLLAWSILFNSKLKNNNTSILVFITKVLQCLLIAVILVVVKTFLVKVLASSFHVDTYFERIRDSLFHQYVLETLSRPSIYAIQQDLKDKVTNLQTEPNTSVPHLKDSENSSLPKTFNMGKNNNLQQDGCVAINVEKLYNMSQKEISTWNIKKLINSIKHTRVTTLFDKFDDNFDKDDSIVETKMINEYEAKVAAKQIFQNVAKQGCKYITKIDLMRFMDEEEAHRAFSLFDGALESHKITPQAFKNYVVNVYQERRALSLSLCDTKTAVNKLHTIINVVLSILVIVIWLLILGIATTKFIVFISSQLLVVVFIFGNTCKNTFEAIIFLFVVHPFDIGDRCVIDGNQMVVEEMNILTTIFLGELNTKIWYPNSVLATKPIQNFYRSPAMGESFEFFVHSSTSAEKIAYLKNMIGRYIASKPQHWKSSFTLLVLDLDQANKMKLSLNLTHTMNYQDFNEKVVRRSDLLWEMKRHLEGLGIQYQLPTLKVHIENLNTVSNKI